MNYFTTIDLEAQLLKDGAPLSRPTWAYSGLDSFEGVGKQATFKLFPGSANDGEFLTCTVLITEELHSDWVMIAAINRLLSRVAVVFGLGNRTEIQRLKIAPIIGHLIHQMKYIMRLGTKVIDGVVRRTRIQRVFGVNAQIREFVLDMKIGAVIVACIGRLPILRR